MIPDRVPSKGETVDVRNYDKDVTETCLVESVARNARTVELVVRTPAGAMRTLVMKEENRYSEMLRSLDPISRRKM